jgi:hypothetical protein
MAAFVDLSDFLATATGANTEFITSFTAARVAGLAPAAPVAGRWTSLWLYDGNPGAGVAAPAGPAVPTRATAGALGQANPTGGRQKWLTYASMQVISIGMGLLYDRLLTCGGIVGNVTTPQTVGGALTRNTGGVGNKIYLEIQSIIGTTQTTVSASYTNSDGTPGRTTPTTTIGATGFREVTRAIELPLQSGDVGVQSVETVTFTGTTGTAGDVAVVIAKPILALPCTALGSGGDVSLLAKGRGPIAIEDNACLALLWMPGSTTTPEICSTYFFVEK